MGFSEGLRLWLGSNLVSDRVTGGLTWTFDLKGAPLLLTHSGAAPMTRC